VTLSDWFLLGNNNIVGAATIGILVFKNGKREP
jgi:hypothetical protein